MTELASIEMNEGNGRGTFIFDPAWNQVLFRNDQTGYTQPWDGGSPTYENADLAFDDVWEAYKTAEWKFCSIYSKANN